jgi:hypothetical protein
LIGSHGLEHRRYPACVTRLLIRSFLVLVVTAAAVLVGWRVLKPAELLIVSDKLSPISVPRKPNVTGVANAAPLIVDGNYRVFATQRQVRSDGPIASPFVLTTRWSLRRWPQQVSGIVSIGTTVISRWSDGKLIAQDARNGHIEWRADGPAGPGYTGFRVGAQTAWAPVGMHTSPGYLLVRSGTTLDVYSAYNGHRTADVQLPADCADGFTTSGGRYVCSTGAYNIPDGAPVAGWPAGKPEPLGCDAAASGCRGLRDGDGKGWMTDNANARRTVALDTAGSTVIGDRVYTAAGALIDPDKGTVVGHFPDMTPLGALGRRMVFLDARNYLIEIDHNDGSLISQSPVGRGRSSIRRWKTVHWQVDGRFAAIERLHLDAPDDPADPNYYFAGDAVVILALG